MSEDDLMATIKRDKPFYDQSGGGVTFRAANVCCARIGREPRQKCKAAGINVAVDTAGAVPWDYFEKVLPFADLFLYDVKTLDPIKHKKYVGADNSLILENLIGLFDRGAKRYRTRSDDSGVNDDERILPLSAITSRLIPIAKSNCCRITASAKTNTRLSDLRLIFSTSRPKKRWLLFAPSRNKR
ncbi:MAG: hypothetical protein ACLUSP_00280 [Christensenellales bacterium]